MGFQRENVLWDCTLIVVPLLNELPIGSNQPASHSVYHSKIIVLANRLAAVDCNSTEKQKGLPPCIGSHCFWSRTIRPSSLVSLTLTGSGSPGFQAGIFPCPAWRLNRGPSVCKVDAPPLSHGPSHALEMHFLPEKRTDPLPPALPGSPWTVTCGRNFIS